MISSIILAAGLSSRFGAPKPLAKLAGETVIERVQKTLVSSSVAEIIIVLGANADDIKPFLLKHTRVKVVYNKDYNLGQTSSFQAGIEAVDPQAEGILLWPVDYPLVKLETINELVRIFIEKKPAVLIPTHQGRKGHPPIFHSRLREEFQRLSVREGINNAAKAHSAESLLLPVPDPGVIQTFNTIEEFEKLKHASFPRD